MVLRDRSSFDLEGRGQNDRDPIAFLPGLLLVYNDEAHGYGNFGVDDPPAVSPLDSQPQPGNNTPALDDAAWTDASGDNLFSDSGAGHTDNYEDPGSADGNWHFQFNCLSFNVTSMTGETIGPLNGFDLTANVNFTVGAGCAPFDYGYEGGNFNVAPTAVAQARPNPAVVGEEVTFDGSASTDDASGLSYDWDFGDGGTGTGQVAHHTYTAAGEYDATLTVTDAGGLDDTDVVTVTVVGRPNLRITNITASNNRAREGEKVTFTATVNNNGGSLASASQTEFRLDGTPVGTVATDPIPANSSIPVSFELRTNGLRGEHTMRATADAGNAVNESNESDNSGDLTFTIKGNKVQNGSFEQASSSGDPEGWSGSSTGAGTASYDQNSGTEGSKAAKTSGNGGNAALYGPPAWTSEPVAVSPGQVLDLVVSVSSTGVSTAPSAGLVYLGPLGNVLDTVTLITVPVSTQGFETLEQAVTIPVGVADVRVTLTGFSPADLSTSGTVTFDDVGLFDH